MLRLVIGMACWLFSMALMAATPATFMGEEVKEVPWYVLDRQPITLHVTDSGPIPEESEHLRFVTTGHLMKKAAKGQAAHYRWTFGIELLKGAKPVHVVIEDVTGKVAIPMVDDASPSLKNGANSSVWSGEQSSDCEINRQNDCAAWIFRSGLQLFVFRATFTLDDSSQGVLYQASAFYPERMKPVFEAIGVN